MRTLLAALLLLTASQASAQEHSPEYLTGFLFAATVDCPGLAYVIWADQDIKSKFLYKIKLYIYQTEFNTGIREFKQQMLQLNKDEMCNQIINQFIQNQ